MLGRYLEQVRSVSPLIHNITNYVTANDCANITLACGASPIMAEEISEVEEITALSKALVINIGTLKEQNIPAMLAAGRKANEKKLPVILDPVGIGASQFRTDTVLMLLRIIQFTVIRGNKSEIKKIYQCLLKEGSEEDSSKKDRSEKVKNEKDKSEKDKNKNDTSKNGISESGISKNYINENDKSEADSDKEEKRLASVIATGDILRGVDVSVSDIISEETLEDTITLAWALARITDSVIVITGAIDIVATDSRAYIIRNGCSMMSRITGSGCMLSSLIGAFCGANSPNYPEACAAAVGAMGIAGEMAYAKAIERGEGTAAFRIYLIDAISIMSGEVLNQKAYVELIKRGRLEEQPCDNT